MDRFKFSDERENRRGEGRDVVPGISSSYFDAISFGPRPNLWIMIPDDGNGVR